MKISKNMIRTKSNRSSCMTGKVTASADRRIAAASSNGTEQFAIVAPKGLDYVPQINDDSVVLPTEKGGICLGVRRKENMYDILPGEMALYSLNGAAVIVLKNDGRILLNGRFVINGREYSGEEESS